QRTPGAPGRCRTGSPCSRRYGSKRSRADRETQEERPDSLGEPAALALEVLEPDIDQRAAARERPARAGCQAELSRRGRARAERQLPAARAEPERRESATHLQARGPAQRVERTSAGRRPRTPRERSRESHARTRRPPQTTAHSVGQVCLRRDDVAQAGAQPVIRAREDGEAQRRQQVEERAPRDPDAVVADLVALL